MAYSLQEQLTLDLDWYFRDRFNRICVAASGGGLLPESIAEQSERNDSFHDLILKQPLEFKIARNPNINDYIQGVDNQNIDTYFSSFEELARRGVFAFDKLKLNEPTNGVYILAVYPIYNSEIDPYPIDKKHLGLIPWVSSPIISRTNTSFSNTNFKPINLNEILNHNNR